MSYVIVMPLNSCYHGPTFSWVKIQNIFDKYIDFMLIDYGKNICGINIVKAYEVIGHYILLISIISNYYLQV